MEKYTTKQDGRARTISPLGGDYALKWDDETQMSVNAHAALLSQFAKAGGFLDRLVKTCPMRLTSNNAPEVRDLIATVMVSMVNGATRFRHFDRLRGDAASAELFGVRRFMSCDSVRRNFASIPAEEALPWVWRENLRLLQDVVAEDYVLDLDPTVKPLYGCQEGAELFGVRRFMSCDSVRRNFASIPAEEALPWVWRENLRLLQDVVAEDYVLDLDPTVKPLYGCQEGAELGYSPQKPGRPSHCYHTLCIAELRMALAVVVHPGNETAGTHSRSMLAEYLAFVSAVNTPRLVRGDVLFGNESVIGDCEGADVRYLFKTKRSKAVRGAWCSRGVPPRRCRRGGRTRRPGTSCSSASRGSSSWRRRTGPTPTATSGTRSSPTSTWTRGTSCRSTAGAGTARTSSTR